MLLVRERPPTDLHVTVDTPDGNHYRWAPDAHKAENISGGINFSTTMPGGFDTGNVTLARDPAVDYQDLGELATLRFRGAGGVIAGEYRLESSPRTSGDTMQIVPGLVGWQSHLDDDASAAMIFVDQELGSWHDPPLNRQVQVPVGGFSLGTETTALDGAGNPAQVLEFDGPWTSPKPVAEAWYDAGPTGLAGMFFNYFQSLNVNPVDTNWAISVFGANNDDLSDVVTLALDLSGQSGFFAPMKRYLLIQQEYGTTNASAPDNTQYQTFWRMAVWGDHGLPAQGSWPTSVGVLSSDVEAFAVGRWAPHLKWTYDNSGSSSIQPSTFVIPQLTFPTPTTSSDMVKTATAFELRDWGVWDGPTGPTYYSNPRGARGNRWLARSTDCKLQGTGPQIQDLFNGVMVTFQDFAGITRYVGPPGSAADVEDASLLDTDPQNPANQLGIRRWGPNPPLSVGLASSDVAIQLGQAYLQQQLELNQAGQASHVGYVQEAATGVLFPAWAMRAGDQVSYVDASDRSFRRIVSTAYDDASRTNSIQLDSPPETMTALLSRYGVELTNATQSS